MTRVRTCPKCRALLEPGTRSCPYCGAAQRSAPVTAAAEATATSKLGLYVIGIHLVLYLLMVVLDPARGDRESGALEPSAAALAAFGMSAPDLVRECGQYWRLLAAIFLHLDVVHLLFNSVAIFILVPPAAVTFGAHRTTCIYLLTGVAAALASHLMGNAGAGASGAVCGLIGALAVYGKRRGGPEGRLLMRRMVTWAVLILAFGFLFPRVDNTAHFAGLVGGALVGWAAAAVRVIGGRGERVWRAGAFAGIAVVMAAGVFGVAPSVFRSFELREVELYTKDVQRKLGLLTRVSLGEAAVEDLPKDFGDGPAGSEALSADMRSAIEATRNDPKGERAAEAQRKAILSWRAWEQRIACTHAFRWVPK